MIERSVLAQAREVQLASTLIALGARLQFLEAHVNMSRERLVRLYLEIKGASPPKGLFPNSPGWYMRWRPNIDASLFLNIFVHIRQNMAATELETFICAYQLYVDQIEASNTDPALNFTRAHMLMRMYEDKTVQLTSCSRCTGRFVTDPLRKRRSSYVCVLCRPPARAGKQNRPKGAPRLVHSATQRPPGAGAPPPRAE